MLLSLQQDHCMELINASANGSEEGVRNIITSHEGEVNLDYRDANGFTALHHACSNLFSFLKNFEKQIN